MNLIFMELLVTNSNLLIECTLSKLLFHAVDFTIILYSYHHTIAVMIILLHLLKSFFIIVTFSHLTGFNEMSKCYEKTFGVLNKKPS